MTFGGVAVLVSPYLEKWEQCRFPRSKKVRIRKKWRKNRGNYRALPAGVLIGDTLLVNPAMHSQLKEATNASQFQIR